MGRARTLSNLMRVTDALTLPSGNTAGRPAGALAGSQRFNTQTGSVEFYDGANWISTNLIPTVNSVTGTIYAGAASNLTLSIANATDQITVRFSEGGGGGAAPWVEGGKTAGTGGLGGGGNGARSSSLVFTAGAAGAANTGGGLGDNLAAANGGSGIVIVRYAFP